MFSGCVFIRLYKAMTTLYPLFWKKGLSLIKQPDVALSSGMIFYVYQIDYHYKNMAVMLVCRVSL